MQTHRVELIDRAIVMIRCQIGCNRSTAFDLLHERATSDRSTIARTAARILAGAISWAD